MENNKRKPHQQKERVNVLEKAQKIKKTKPNLQRDKKWRKKRPRANKLRRIQERERDLYFLGKCPSDSYVVEHIMVKNTILGTFYKIYVPKQGY